MAVRNPFSLGSIALQIALALVCVGLIVFGAIRSDDNIGLVCLAVGLLGLIVLGATFSLAWLLRDWMGAGERRTTLTSNASPQSTENLLAHIHENSMLSDIAKRVLFRDRELNLLRRAIEEDIAHGDYHAGLQLCDDMANLFGQKEESEAFRARILQAGRASYEARVQEALDQLEHALSMRDWARAHNEAASIRRLYPTHHLVQDLDQRILHSREEHKRELEAQFISAAQRDDVDAAMPLLKQLDRYLTREEATRLAEIAQNVLMKRRDNLSMQFKLAVNDRRWAEAAHIGDALMTEYPNTKMADEVRSMIDMLRMRASQAAAVVAQS